MFWRDINSLSRQNGVFLIRFGEIVILYFAKVMYF